MPQPGFKPTIAQLPATGYGPRPGVIFPGQTTSSAADLAEKAKQSLLNLPGGPVQPRFIVPFVNPELHREPPAIPTETLIQGLGIARLILGPEKFATAVKTSVGLLFGETVTEAVTGQVLVEGLPPISQLVEGLKGVILPSEVETPFEHTQKFLLGVPFGIEHSKLDDELLKQNNARALILVGRFQNDLSQFTGPTLQSAQHLFTQFLTAQRSLVTTDRPLGVTAIGPHLVADENLIRAFDFQLLQLERQFQLNAGSGFGGPVSGPVIGRGDQADP